VLIIPKIYQLLGYSEAPENIFRVSTVLLVAALAVGIILVIISMLVNIIIGIKSRNAEAIIFGPSGVLGLIFYVGLIAGLGLQMLAGIPIMQPYYVIPVIVLPLVLMFFKEPIVNAVKLIKTKDSENKKGKILAYFRSGEGKEKKSIGNFIIEGFIELFETCLTYLTNTMSYLRIGGFVLSHAGLMLVFDVVANMAGEGAGKIIILVIGNLFVTGFEGLLVGIQVLRLEFYELFSRFFKGGGKPFSPVTINKTN
ncbi:MAG: V-type ATPase 116kDa subunit family protein, partial [Ruminiclostridium sp.]